MLRNVMSCYICVRGSISYHGERVVLGVVEWHVGKVCTTFFVCWRAAYNCACVEINSI